MPAPPGQPYVTTITHVVNSDNLRTTVNGIAVVPTITAVPGQPGTFEVDIDGGDVTCPGPIRIVEVVNGAEVEKHKADVGPCP